MLVFVNFRFIIILVSLKEVNNLVPLKVPFAQRSMMFGDIRRGLGLGNLEIKLHVRVTQIYCSQLCLQSEKCQSFNFFESGRCQLNSGDAHSEHAIFGNPSNSIYVGMRIDDTVVCAVRGIPMSNNDNSDKNWCRVKEKFHQSNWTDGSRFVEVDTDDEWKVNLRKHCLKLTAHSKNCVANKNESTVIEWLKFIHEKKTWHAARDYCMEIHGTLFNKVNGTLDQLRFLSEKTKDLTWIGVHTNDKVQWNNADDSVAIPEESLLWYQRKRTQTEANFVCARNDGSRNIASADTVEEDELPEDLIGQPTYRGIPKRYEDTKPFHTQKLSHTNILKIGAVYHQELMDKLEKEKLDAISSAVEQSEKQAAEKLKAEVEKLHEYATADRERALRQQKIVHDQQLTEEKMKIESQLNRFWQVKLEEAIEEKDLEMRRAVERTREACMAEIDAMIAKARKEERQLAIEEQEKAKREHDEKLRKEREDAMKDKESAMAKMRKFLEDEKDTAVAAAKIQEQNLAASELATIISAQTAKLMEIEEEIKKRDMEISVRDSAVANLETVKKQLMTDLNDQKLRLEYFVDSVRHFVPGQNEHLIDKRGTKDYIPEVTPIIEGTDF